MLVSIVHQLIIIALFTNTHVYPLRSFVSMQSIQNLGLAVIAIAAGAILDNRGYLVLEVFFCACICSQYFFFVCIYESVVFQITITIV